MFGDTYEVLVRATEELDIARDLLAGVRDHLQSKVAEGQGDIAKKLTVIASLVLVPSLIVGFFGQNFASAFDDRSGRSASRARSSSCRRSCSSRCSAGVAGSEPRRRAEVLEHAVLAARASRVADPPAVPDQQVREPVPVGARDDPLQVALDLDGILLARQPESLREPAHVRVDDDPLRVRRARRRRRSPSCVRRRGAAGARRAAAALAVELFEQHAHRAADRLRLLAEEAGRVDVLLELLLAARRGSPRACGTSRTAGP